MITNHWDIFTIFLYLFMAWFGTYCLKYMVNTDQKYTIIMNSNFKVEKWWFLWFNVWLFFAVFRYISNEIGGTDAPVYIDYFNTCLISDNNLYSYRTEPLFRLFTKTVKLIFNDYHIYFFIIYGVIVGSYIEFTKELSSKNTNVLPVIAGTYIYILSFNTIRNSFSIGILLIAIVYLYKEKYKRAFFSAILSILMHTASVFYAPFLLFYLITKKIKSFRILTTITIACMAVLDILCKILRQLVLNGTLNELFNKLGLGQPFNVYAASNFGDNFWRDLFLFRINRPQFLLAIILIIFVPVIDKNIKKYGNETVAKFDLLKNIVLYDIMLLPVVYWFHVWRGPEYFVLARLLIWGYIAHLLSKKIHPNLRNVFYLGIFVISSFYCFYKINKYWDTSNLTPYLLEPIGYFLDSL